MKPIRIDLKLSGGDVIPKGVVENLVIEVVDEMASFHFKDSNTTRKFAAAQEKLGITSKYQERLQKTFSFYPNIKQQQLSEKILKSIKEQEKHG